MQGRKFLNQLVIKEHVYAYNFIFRELTIFRAADEVWIHKPEYYSGSGQINKLLLVLAAPSLSMSNRKADQRKLGCVFFFRVFNPDHPKK